MISKKDIQFSYTRGKGSGGQHKNKTDSCVTAKHIPTGIVVRVDGRDQHMNKRKAIRNLEAAIKKRQHAVLASQKKAARDLKIQNTNIIRTYHFKRKTVKDHRSSKVSPLASFLNGEVDLLEFST